MSPTNPRINNLLEKQEKAAKLATTATAFIVSICFFVLPVVWSSMFHLLPIATPISVCQQNDPWSEYTDL